MKLLTFLLSALAVLSGCNSPFPKTDAAGPAHPWTNQVFSEDPRDFHFAIVADRTGGARPGVFENAVDKLNLLKPEFVICIGDLVEGNADNDSQADQQWDQLDTVTARLQMRFFYLPGNHDIGRPVMLEKWRSGLGETYYHFVYRNCLFLCLNTEDPTSRRLSPAQIQYFREVLNRNQDVRWTFIFMHHPLWKGAGRPFWQQFEPLLADRPATIFAGHEHRYSKSVIEGRSAYVLATTGGAIEDTNNPCAFDHVVWVTVSAKGPTIANLLLDGIRDDQPCNTR